MENGKEVLLKKKTWQLWLSWDHIVASQKEFLNSSLFWRKTRLSGRGVAKRFWQPRWKSKSLKSNTHCRKQDQTMWQPASFISSAGRWPTRWLMCYKIFSSEQSGECPTCLCRFWRKKFLFFLSPVLEWKYSPKIDLRRFFLWKLIFHLLILMDVAKFLLNALHNMQYAFICNLTFDNCQQFL